MPEHHHIGATTREWLVAQSACPELAALRIELCGISAAQSGFSFIRHAWACSQILVCHEGEGEVWVDGGWQPCRGGHAYLCPAGTAHAYRAVGGHIWGITWAILIEPPDQTPWLAHGPPRLSTVDQRGFADAVRNLHRETVGLASHSIRGHWAALVALLATRISSEGPLEQRLDRVWEEVDQDLARDWTLSDLARAAQVGPEQLRRLCLRHHQRSPVQQVTWLRMQRAATLLASQRATVADVAQAVGYDNAFAFSTAFKRVLGQPPSAWRAQN
jgi:AraC-like DNA-binding protein/mannose-6-phosphate isomerase-like protein (cupin superfamily)